MRKITGAAAIVAAAALTLSTLTWAAPAFAEPETSIDIEFENDLGLLVTPEELEDLGVSSEEIARQEQLFSEMTPAEEATQGALRESQAQVAENLAALPDVPVEAPPAAPVGEGVITPFIYLAFCWPNNDYYSVYWHNITGDVVDCFAESGTYTTIGYTGTYAVRPGNNIGRVYYYYGAYFYWSPWRGKTMTTYYFDGPITAERVQIQ